MYLIYALISLTRTTSVELWKKFDLVQHLTACPCHIQFAVGHDHRQCSHHSQVVKTKNEQTNSGTCSNFKSSLLLRICHLALRQLNACTIRFLADLIKILKTTWSLVLVLGNAFMQ